MPPTKRRSPATKRAATRPVLALDLDGDLDDSRIDVPLPYLEGAAQRTETFTAYSDPGVGVVGSWVGATGPQRTQLALALLTRCLVDDDGLPAGYASPLKSTNGKRVVDRQHADYDARQDDRSKWSSKRRFLDLAGDPGKRLPATVLVKVLDALVDKATGGRPTGRSARS